MRTTIDLPEDLLRRAKATAALRGVKLKDLIAKCIDSGLRTISQLEEPKIGHSGPLLVTIKARSRKIPSLTNSEIFEILDGEDD